MSNIEETVGFFIGREKLGEGVCAQGKNAGKKWERFKLKFKPTIDSEKAFSMTAFSPLKFKQTLQPQELKEDSQYKLLFNQEERTTPDGSPYTSRTCAGIYVHKDKDKDKDKEGNGAPASTPVQLHPAEGLAIQHFQEFKAKYLAVCKDNGIVPNTVHMVGSFVSTYDKERVSELVGLCKQAIAEAETDSQLPPEV